MIQQRYLKIIFCDSCYFCRRAGNQNFCEKSKRRIDEDGMFVLIPDWCTLENAKGGRRVYESNWN